MQVINLINIREWRNVTLYNKLEVLLTQTICCQWGWFWGGSMLKSEYISENPCMSKNKRHKNEGWDVEGEMKTNLKCKLVINLKVSCL